MNKLRFFQRDFIKTSFLVLLTVCVFFALPGFSQNGAGQLAEAKQFLGTVGTGNVNAVEQLIDSGVDLEAEDSQGRNALHYAVHTKNAEMLSLLIASGVDPMKRDALNQLPLHQAASENFAEGVKLLLEAGVPVDALGFNSPSDGPTESTALHLAVQMNAIDSVKVLIAAGADVNALTNVNDGHFRRSPLFWAQKSGFQEIADLLAENGAVRMPPGATEN